MDNQSLQYYIQRYAEGKISEVEWKELKYLMEQPENAKVLDQLMDDQLKEWSGAPDDFPALTSRIVLAVKAKTTAANMAPSTHRVHFLKTAWVRYAAAIILIAGTITAIIVSSDRKPKSSGTGNLAVSSADIGPGRDRAILTLANGEQIILDSTQGNILKQGSLTVVNLAGKLKYEGVGTGAEYNTISTPKGGQYQIILPDGSKVWLNAASSIKFPTAFTGNVRNVEMTGEAYMEIAGNSKQSFIVNANGAEIQVLGTSFNVNAYEDESAVKTTLISGSVKVIRGMSSSSSNKSGQTSSAVVGSSDQQPVSPGTGSSKNAVILKPGQQAVLKSTTGIFVVNSPDIEQALAWKNGIFDFTGADFESVMKQLERWYDIEVQYNRAIPKMTFDGKMYRNVNFSGVLEMLTTMDVKFRMEGKTLIVL